MIQHQTQAKQQKETNKQIIRKNQIAVYALSLTLLTYSSPVYLTIPEHLTTLMSLIDYQTKLKIQTGRSKTRNGRDKNTDR